MKRGFSFALGLSVALSVAACGGGSSSAPALKPVEPAKPAAPAQQPAASGQQPAASGQQPAAAQKPAAAPAGAPKRISIGSTAASSSTYTYFVALGKLINEKLPSLQATVVESGATVENMRRIAKGEFHIGNTGDEEVYGAVTALPPTWEKEPIPDMRMLWIYRVAPYNFVVREDSNITTLQQLEGKDFNPGLRGSATEKAGENALNALGIKARLVRGTTEDTLASIKDKRVVGYVKTGAGVTTPDSSILDLQTTAKIRFLTFTADDEKKVLEKFPFYSFGTVPANVYKDQAEYRTIFSSIGVGAMKSFDDDLAYQLTKTVNEDKTIIWEGFPAVKGIDVAKQTIELARSPLHKSSIKYFKEIGLQPKEHQVPTEAK
ncbi:MAG: TAXI family TRAP transporter solute-binding subunit [Chloroflexi bacterium]|nr:TAXI family TRAP transporter solute-binding subunit [Chloroflexota bacterium]